MMNRLVTLLGAAVTGAILGATGTTYVVAQQPPQVKRVELLRQPASGLEGKELVVYTAEVPPGGVAPRHWHPGDEAIYGLEGSLIIQPDHGQAVDLKPGQIAFNPTKHVHAARNDSTSQSAKVVVFAIAEKGQPLAIPAQ
jgi:quercetin dioxygenase-like cupin family protein